MYVKKVYAQKKNAEHSKLKNKSSAQIPITHNSKSKAQRHMVASALSLLRKHKFLKIIFWQQHTFSLNMIEVS